MTERSRRLAPGMALVFDLDGVIVDTNPVHREAWIAYNRRFAIRTDEAMLEFMYGKHNDDIVRHYFGELLTPVEVASHGAAKEALYREMMGPRVRSSMVAGVADFIERWSEAPVALASNAEPANIAFLLAETGLGGYFRAVIDGQQVANPKPHPDIYLRAAELCGVRPANAIVFEDSHTGVAAALAAGARVVGLRTTLPSLPGADLTINDFESPDLEPWLLRQEVRE